MQFSKLDQYQDNGGSICLRFFFDSEYETEAPQEHWLQIGDITGNIVIKLSLTGGYYQSPWAPSKEESARIVAECCELVGGESMIRKLLNDGVPTGVGIPLAIADNTGKLQWVGKYAQTVAA